MIHSLESRAQNSSFPIFNFFAAFITGFFNPIVLFMGAIATIFFMYQLPFQVLNILLIVAGVVIAMLLMRQLCRWLARQTSAYKYFMENPDVAQSMLHKLEKNRSAFHYEIREFKTILRLPK